MLKSVRWLAATAVVLLVFGVAWTVADAVYGLDKSTSLQIAAVSALAVGLPLSWWSFRGQLLDEPAEVAWVTWRRVPAAPAQPLAREDDLARLEAALGADGSNVAVVTGPSGVGKTELAASYARARIAEGWPMVAWVNAATHEEILAGLLEFADALTLRVSDEDSARACERLRQHPPAGTRPSVIVFDGVTDVEAVRPYLPGGDSWRVVVTTAAPHADRLGTEVALTALPAADAARQSGLPEDVAAELGGLPVGLAVAVATQRERRSDQPYLGRLRSVAGLLAGARGHRPGPAGSGEQASTAAVLLALAGVGFDSDPATRRVLGLLGVLSPGGVSRTLLYEAEDHARVDEVLDALSRWQLLTSRMDGDGVFLHELTRQVVLDRLRADRALPRAVADAAGLLERVTFGEDQAWDRRGEGDQLVAHVAALSTSAGSVAAALPTETTERVLDLRHWATRHLGAVGDGSRAVAMAEASRSECAALLGPEHPDTLVAADSLVIAYAAAGRAAEGIPLAEQTLATRQRVLGPDHADTLASRYTLGYVHEYARRMEDAVALYDAAFTAYARVYGPDHPQTATVGAALGRARALQPAPERASRHRAR